VNEQGGTGEQASEPLVVVADLSRVKVVAHISEYDVLKLKQGLSVTLRTEALPDRSWQGKVEHIADLPKTEPVAQAAGSDTQVVYPVEIRPEAGIPVRLGSRLIVEINVSGEKVMGIPESAVQEIGDKSYVFVVENGKAVRKEVKTGRRNGEFVQILSGLKADETVISVTPEGLVSGSEVKIR
jgi:HlyD family secretion protein